MLNFHKIPHFCVTENQDSAKSTKPYVSLGQICQIATQVTKIDFSAPKLPFRQKVILEQKVRFFTKCDFWMPFRTFSARGLKTQIWTYVLKHKR